MATVDCITFMVTSMLFNRLEILRSKIKGFNGYAQTNVHNVNAIIGSFIESVDAYNYISDFKKNVADYIYDFDKGSDDSETLISNIYNLKNLESSEVLTQNTSMLSKFGITNWEDLATMKELPNNFIDGIHTYIFYGVIYKALSEYPCSELYIAVNLAVIKYNLYSYGMDNLMSEYTSLRSAMYPTGDSVEHANLVSKLEDCFLDSNGDFSYPLAISGVSVTASDKIKSFERVLTFIFNANRNSITRKIGNRTTFLTLDPEEYSFG